MLIAVSILSPVKIHIFIFALIKDLIVTSTLSYNLSSTAVAPIRSKFTSI